MGDNSIKFLATESSVKSCTGSAVVNWEAGENGSENLELEGAGS